jgi:hypothetical protein
MSKSKRMPPLNKEMVGAKVSRNPSAAKKKTPASAKKPAFKTEHSADGKHATKTQGNDRRTLSASDPFFSRSTTVAAQRSRVLAALRAGPKTTHDLRCIGIYQAPARVKELRDVLGYIIETTRVTLVDRDGYSHSRAGRYELISDPPQLSLDFGRKAANDPVVKKRGKSS